MLSTFTTLIKSCSYSRENRLLGLALAAEGPLGQQIELQQLTSDIEALKDNETSVARLNRVSRWSELTGLGAAIGGAHKTNVMFERTNQGDKQHEHFQFSEKSKEGAILPLTIASSKGKEFEQDEFLRALLQANAKSSVAENLSDVPKRKDLRRLAALESLRTWVRESLPPSYHEYDIGKPKQTTFASIGYGIYSKDGKHLFDITNDDPTFQIPVSKSSRSNSPKDGAMIANPSGLLKEQFIQDFRQGVTLH